jgi:hypothetical protein
MPLSPQRVWRAIRDGAAGASGEAATASPHWEEPAQSGGLDASAIRSDDEGSQA